MELNDDEIAAVIGRARELGLLTFPAPVEDDPWLNIEEASAHTGLAKGTLRNLVSEGRLPRHGPKGFSLPRKLRPDPRMNLRNLRRWR